MDITEFKSKYPHLAHLEDNALWDAMELATLKEQPPMEVLPDDHEIGHIQQLPGGYTVSFTKGVMRMMEKVFAPSPNFKPSRPSFQFITMDVSCPQTNIQIAKRTPDE
jgi:hypothetical protein